MVLFGIIYTVDCSSTVGLRQFQPTSQSEWQITERESDGTYSEFLGDRYRHRKYVAMLDRKQFQQFIDHLGLYASTVETMGSLGAPIPNGGISLGLVPAVSFGAYCDDYELNAYVTPYVVRHSHGDPKEGEWLPVRAQGMQERDWERIRDAMLTLWTDFPKHRSRLAKCQLARMES
jgi:hypothetical protein